jgi:hypothetical protein
LNLTNNWIAGPGQFWILGISWGSVALFYTVMALKLGKAIHSEPDGCLLAICNLVCVPVGGLVGLRFLRFPYNLLCSMFLALVLPSLLTGMWIRRTDPRKKR